MKTAYQKSRFAHVGPIAEIVTSSQTGPAKNSDYFWQGYRAAKIGLRFQECPYYKTSTAYGQWTKGNKLWTAYGQKRDYRKIDMWIIGKADSPVWTTTWAKNLTIARDKLARSENHLVEQIGAEYRK